MPSNCVCVRERFDVISDIIRYFFLADIKQKPFSISDLIVSLLLLQPTLWKRLKSG